MDFKVTCSYGYKQLFGFYKPEKGWYVYYGYSISYNGDVTEVSRTEPTPISKIQL